MLNLHQLNFDVAPWLRVSYATTSRVQALKHNHSATRDPVNV